MIDQASLRILNAMLEKTKRLIEIYEKYGKDKILEEYVLSDSIQFEFEKLYEDSTRLSPEFRVNHPELHVSDLRSIRNRVAHEYESVSLNVLLDTIENDIPVLAHVLQFLIENK